MPGTTTIFAENAGVIGLIMSRGQRIHGISMTTTCGAAAQRGAGATRLEEHAARCPVRGCDKYHNRMEASA